MASDPAETIRSTDPSRTTVTPRLGPYCRPLALAKLDGRTKEAALMRRVRAELTAHCGSNPTFPQRVLIERAAVLALRIAQIEKKMMSGETLTLHDNNHAIAWFNAYRRTLSAIGLAPAATAKPMDPYDYARLVAAEDAA